MSAFAQVEQRVKEIVEAAVGVLYRKNKEQDERLKSIETRLEALESVPEPSSAAKSSRPTVAAKARSAKAGE
jgi:cell division septum initiation protein DivIVA